MRSPVTQKCGGCARGMIHEGAPMLVIELPHVKRKLLRGECCAGDAPPSLPLEERRHQSTKPMRHVSALKLPIDVRARQFKETA